MMAEPSLGGVTPDDRSGFIADNRTGYMPDGRAGFTPDEPEGYAGAEQEPPPRRRLGRWLALLALLALAVAAAGAGYHYREQVMGLVASFSASSTTALSTATSGPATSETAAAEKNGLEIPPFAGFRGDAAAIDAGLQATPLWRLVKHEFPDWYKQRLDEAAALAADSKDDAVIGQLMARKLVALRRQHVAEALSATPETLRAVALAYLNSIDRLSSKNAEACQGFIMHAEAEPLVVAMLRGTEDTAHLQAGIVAVFKAIAEGRQLPRVHARPTQEQRDMLTAELIKKGWTGADFQILANDRTMAEAPATKVCQLVHDFFSAQLAVPDAEAQMRLLVNSVRPIFVVSG